MIPHADNPYRIPTDREYMLHISGGRTSGYMLYHVLDAHDGRLPSNARAIFANTGKEREETLVFLDRMELEWGAPITWVEYQYRTDRPGGRGPAKQKNWFREVYFDRRLRPLPTISGAFRLVDSASRRGEPFAQLIRVRRMLPNVVMRMCTEELKVNTAKRFASHVLGWQKPRNVIGIRHDEPQRVRKALWEECAVEYPMVHAKVAESDVMDFWARQPFDLGLRPDQGNCDLCFLKGVGKLRRLIAEEPLRANWWIHQEMFRATATRKKHIPNREELARFLKRYSYAQLRATPTLPLDEPDDSVSCFCGD